MRRLLRNIVLGLARRFSPTAALVVSFAAMIVVGGLLLTLPPMTTAQGSLGLLDALFTATSAVCVTGLAVLDTGRDFTTAGQLVVLLLIQLGGLGIMTYSVFFLRMMGGSSPLGLELALRESIPATPKHDVPGLARTVVLLTLSVELIGFLLLMVFFLQDLPAGEAAYAALFHSISAFCNAGFSLWSDSLTRYADHIGVNITVMGLIVAGGLGFVVINELIRFRRGPRRSLSLHSRIVLTTTAILISLGFFAFLSLEWNNVLAGRGSVERVLVALFQAVTPRTAGFNTADYALMTNSTLLITIFLMFVGGSPGSTAGGVKTVSIALLMAMAVSRFRGFSKVNVFRRSVSDAAVGRAVAVVLMAFTVVFIALALLMITETNLTNHVNTRDDFVKILFETVSAYGTVGLSMGETRGLTGPGRAIIIVCMFLGRVGPLTLGLAMMGRSAAARPYNYGKEDVIVG